MVGKKTDREQILMLNMWWTASSISTMVQGPQGRDPPVAEVNVVAQPKSAWLDAWY